MGKIVAIGGGEMGRPGHPVETTAIDEEIIRLSGKRSPKLLFIPTASSDSETYFDVVKKHFGTLLGCQTDVLYLLANRPSGKEIQDRILSSDIIYVGGGNTLKMMTAWRKLGVVEALEKAHRQDIVLSGVSAGAICWFRYGSSDSGRFANADAGLIRVSGMDMIHALCCPHYDAEADRRPHLRELMSKTPGAGVAIDNCCALEVVDGEYRILASRSSANAFKVYYDKGKYHEETIDKKTQFSPIRDLLTK